MTTHRECLAMHCEGFLYQLVIWTSGPLRIVAEAVTEVAGRSRHACVAQAIHVGHTGKTKRQTEASRKEAAHEAGTACKHAPQAYHAMH